MSRNTIRKYLRADTVEPKFKVPARPSKLDPFAEKLSAWLRIEASKSRKQRRTAKQMHADLVVLGYDGSYNRVAAFVRVWKADRQRDAQTSGRGTFVPLVFQPGEAFQFDWSEDWAMISVRIYPERIVVAAEGQILCEHERVIQRSHDQPGRTIYDWRHYLAVIQRKPGALRNGAPFTEMPTAFRQLQGHLLRHPGGDREMVEVLSLVLHHDEQAVLCAVELALDADVPTKTHILNILHRLLDGKDATPPRIDAPQALILRREPKANVARYDTLRNKDLRHAS